MGTRFNLDACAQTRGGKLPSGEVRSALIAEIETFDDAINVATVRDFKQARCGWHQ